MENSIIKKISFELDEKNKPIDSPENLALLAEAYDIKFSYDLITRKELITLPEHLEKKYYFDNPFFSVKYLCQDYGMSTRCIVQQS